MKDSVELWEKHPDIGKLEVSSLGKVRSVDGHYYKSRHNHNGYLCVGFRINGNFFNKRVHRLVAQTFIPNPNNLPQINHKDGNRAHNHVENLEWCTASYNQKYREKYGISQTEAAGTPVIAINLSTLEVSHFRSQGEASRALGISQGNICYVIKGRRNCTGGYWFTNDDEKAIDVINHKLHEIKHRAVN